MPIETVTKLDLLKSLDTGFLPVPTAGLEPGSRLGLFLAKALLYLLDRSGEEDIWLYGQTYLGKATGMFPDVYEQHWVQVSQPFNLLNPMGYGAPSSCAFGLVLSKTRGREIVVRTGGDNGDSIESMEVVETIRESDLAIDTVAAGEQFIRLIGGAENEE